MTHEFRVVEVTPDVVAHVLQSLDDEGWDLVSHAVYVVSQPRPGLLRPGEGGVVTTPVYSLVFRKLKE